MMVYRRQNPNGLIILQKNRPATIRKSDAYCVLVLLPTRIERSISSIILRENPQHWERVTSHGRTLRCHTQYEAEEARNLLLSGIDDGQWFDVRIEPYVPTKSDVPYHDWVRNVRDRELEKLGIDPVDIPEEHDPSIAQISDKEWLNIGSK